MQVKHKCKYRNNFENQVFLLLLFSWEEGKRFLLSCRGNRANGANGTEGRGKILRRQSHRIQDSNGCKGRMKRREWKNKGTERRGSSG